MFTTPTAQDHARSRPAGSALPLRLRRDKNPHDGLRWDFLDRIGAKRRKTAFGSPKVSRSESISELPNVITSNPRLEVETWKRKNYSEAIFLRNLVLIPSRVAASAIFLSAVINSEEPSFKAVAI